MLPLVFKSDLSYIKNKKIHEYDMKSGGFSVTISENLIKDEPETVKELLSANKKERQIILGLYARRNKKFTKALHNGFRKYIDKFVKSNDINTRNIISIKKDSITYFGKKPLNTKFRNVNFTLRGEYTSYLRLGKLEFFFNGITKEKLLKGFSDDFDMTETLVEEVFTLMQMSENLGHDRISSYLTDIRQSYVNLELTNNYYKELSPHNKYRLKEGISNFSLYHDEIDMLDIPIENVDIEYNYFNIIVPLCKIFI